MNKKFDWDKWHRKALEDSKLENQIFNSIPQSSFEELYDYIAELEAAQRWIPASEPPKEDYVESGATYDLVVQYVDQPAFVIVANYYNKLWCDACTDDWVWIPNEFAKFWRERPLPPC